LERAPRAVGTTLRGLGYMFEATDALSIIPKSGLPLSEKMMRHQSLIPAVRGMIRETLLRRAGAESAR